jgi:hypothetical protein
MSLTTLSSDSFCFQDLCLAPNEWRAGGLGSTGHGVISSAVAAAGWMGFPSPGDYAAFEFPPNARQDLAETGIGLGLPRQRERAGLVDIVWVVACPSAIAARKRPPRPLPGENKTSTNLLS